MYPFRLLNDPFQTAAHLAHSPLFADIPNLCRYMRRGKAEEAYAIAAQAALVFREIRPAFVPDRRFAVR